jgi:hypothetical protein
MSDWATAWRNAGADDDDFDPPNGTYELRIIDTGAFEAKSDGRGWGKVRFEVITPVEHAGRQFEDFAPAGDHNRVGFGMFKSGLTVYGLDPEGIENLGDLKVAMFDLIGNRVSMSVGHNDKGYLTLSPSGARTGKSDIPTNASGFGDRQAQQSLSPQRSFAAAMAGRDDAQAAAAGDDDIPF